jgi:hypothetical protein
MDPNETLQMLRQLAADARASEGYEPWASAFEVLDDWISNGGFLPDDWKQEPF